MRTMKKNKQKFWYALPTGNGDVYELDDNGDPIIDWVEDDGTIHYKETGEKYTVYSQPIMFYSSIKSTLNELHAREYGVDQSSIYSELTVKKGKVPLVYGARIWKDSEIRYKADGSPDPDSADYICKGTMKEFINFDWFLLQRNNQY